MWNGESGTMSISTHNIVVVGMDIIVVVAVKHTLTMAIVFTIIMTIM
jgi:preprotein translocase subunit Sec61beta